MAEKAFAPFLNHIQLSSKPGSGLGARALACAPGTFNYAVNTEWGSPCKGWAKKYYPKGGDFFRPAREALAGGKKGALAFSASGTAFPPTHSQLPGDTVLMQEPKEEHWNRGLTEQGGE